MDAITKVFIFDLQVITWWTCDVPWNEQCQARHKVTKLVIIGSKFFMLTNEIWYAPEYRRLSNVALAL